jgi:hypothetical protein
METLGNVWTSLGTDDTVRLSGFLAGLSWAAMGVNDNGTMSSDGTRNQSVNILTHPLTTLLNGSIYGIVVSYGAEIISSWMPKGTTQIIPLTLGLSVGYYASEFFKS